MDKGALTLLLAAALLCAPALRAAEAADSAATCSVQRWRPSASMWAPAAGGAALLAIGGASQHLQNGMIHTGSRPADKAWSTAAQYVPLAFPWVAKALGADTRSGWGRMAVSQAIGGALMLGTTYGLKHSVKENRPFGHSRNSFPSGHSAMVFFSATAMAIELGDTSPWYAIGAYALATGVAVERVVEKQHFPVDVVAGAGIGILSAELGYYLGDAIFGDRDLGRSALDELREEANLSYLSLISELRWPIGRIGVGPEANVERLPSLQAGVKAGLALDEAWGLTAFVGLQSTPLRVNTSMGSTYVGAQNALGLYLGPTWQRRLSGRLTLNAEAAMGYYRNLNIKSIGHAVAGGSGSLSGRVTAGLVVTLTRALSMKAHVGYELEGYSYTLQPSPAYLVTQGGHASGVRGSLLAGLSTRINF